MLLLEWHSWQQNTTAFPKANSNIASLGMSTNDHFIAILQELACFSAIELNGSSSAPTQFQHRSERIFSFSANRTRSHKVTGTQIATSDGVVGELLQWRPVQEFGVRSTDGRLDTVGSWIYFILLVYKNITCDCYTYA